jgi:hypothetical protein
MRERAWGPVVKVACAAVLCAGGAALIITAFPMVGGATWADAVGPVVVGVALIGIAGVLVGPAVGRLDRHLARDPQRLAPNRDGFAAGVGARRAASASRRAPDRLPPLRRSGRAKRPGLRLSAPLSRC